MSSEPTDPSTRKRGPGRPWPKGVSGNPLGRPRTGLACAEKIRERVDPNEWVEFELAIATDKTKPIAERRAAWLALIDRGYTKPATAHDVNVSSSGIVPRSYAHLTDDQLQAELDHFARLRGEPGQLTDGPQDAGEATASVAAIPTTSVEGL